MEGSPTLHARLRCNSAVIALSVSTGLPITSFIILTSRLMPSASTSLSMILGAGSSALVLSKGVVFSSTEVTFWLFPLPDFSAAC